MGKHILSAFILVYYSTFANADPALWTNDFIAQIGVNAHLDQHATDPNYPVQLAAALKATGIRLLRTGSTADPGTAIMLNLAAAVPGLKYDVFTAKMSNFPRYQNLFNAGVLAALEGPNEPNTVGVNGFAVDRPDASLYAAGCGNGPPASWLYCSEFQRDLYTMVHSGFMGAGPFPGVVVYGPSETGANPKGQWYGLAENVALDPARMAGLTPYVTPTWPDTGANVIGTQSSDFVTSHNYATGSNASHTFQDNFDYLSMLPNDPITGFNITGIDGWYQEHENGWWGDTAGFPNANGWFGYTASEAPSIPSVTTETSWTVDRTLTSPVGPGVRNLDPVTQGEAALDLYLDYFSQWGKLGAGAGAGMYWYEMFDADGSRANQGFYPPYVSTGTLGPPTPAVTFLSNMIAIMTDPSPTRPSLGAFSYTVSDKAGACADKSPESTVHTQLFQKGSQFMIAVWDERASNIPNSGDTVTITFADHLTHVWNAYDPTVKSTSLGSGTGTAIANVALTNHPKFYLLTK